MLHLILLRYHITPGDNGHNIAVGTRSIAAGIHRTFDLRDCYDRAIIEEERGIDIISIRIRRSRSVDNPGPAPAGPVARSLQKKKIMQRLHCLRYCSEGDLRRDTTTTSRTRRTASRLDTTPWIVSKSQAIGEVKMCAHLAETCNLLSRFGLSVANCSLRVHRDPGNVP